MDVRGGGAAAEDARVVKPGYESEDDEAPRPLRHRDDDMPDAAPGAVRVIGPGRFRVYNLGFIAATVSSISQCPRCATGTTTCPTRRLARCVSLGLAGLGFTA